MLTVSLKLYSSFQWQVLKYQFEFISYYEMCNYLRA